MPHKCTDTLCPTCEHIRNMTEEEKQSAHRGVADMLAGRVQPWLEVKTELGLETEDASD